MNGTEAFQSHMVLGIELGSSRIKATLTDERHRVISAGVHDWENKFENGCWTYSMDDVWTGIRHSFSELASEYLDRFGVPLTHVDAIGISGMMHGYLPFSSDGTQLAAFRTWRNTCTGPAAELLSSRFGFNIPQRWSVAHILQAVLNGETHVTDLAYMTTLAGYVHYMLTGEKVLGIGDASGMFPIDSSTLDYDADMAESFDELMASLGCPVRLRDVFPKVLCAGEQAGTLTEMGALLLDPTGNLHSGIPFCPPEGDAGTGMVATNSVAPHTGNVSAGTSIFAMAVLDKPLSGVYPEIDMVTTPSGSPVAMVHCNTCTSDLDAWVRVLGEALEAAGASLTRSQTYELFYRKAMEGEPDCGGLLNFNFYSGEPVIDIAEGCPLFLRRPDAELTFANFARAQLYSTLAALKLGLDILLVREKVSLNRLLGHGGLFKVPVVGQKMMASALGVPVSVLDTASEGGPWGMALLAGYLVWKKPAESLEEYLDRSVFSSCSGSTEYPDQSDTAGFIRFLDDYVKCIPVERLAADSLK